MHEMAAAAISNVDRDKQIALVEKMTDLVAAAGNDLELNVVGVDIRTEVRAIVVWAESG